MFIHTYFQKETSRVSKRKKMQTEQQIATAVRIAAATNSATFAEHWLYDDAATAPAATSAVLDIANGAEELELKLSYPAALFAVVSGAARTVGIVGNDKDGYQVADMLADNFPNGPILKGYNTLGDVVRYVAPAIAGGSFAVELMETPRVKKAKTADPPPEEQPKEQQPVKPVRSNKKAAAAAPKAAAAAAATAAGHQ